MKQTRGNARFGSAPVRRARLPAEFWPLLLSALLLGVSTASVLWFMNEAIDNEQLASRHRIAEVYRHQVAGIRQRLQRAWEERFAILAGLARDNPSGAGAFRDIVAAGLADAVVFHGADGQPVYPDIAATPTHLVEGDERWEAARQWERSGTNALAAAVVYGLIAAASPQPDEAARAGQAQLRCLVRAGHHTAALRLVDGPMQQHPDAVDEQGRMILPNAELLAMELAREAGDPAFQRLADRLRERLLEYGQPALPGQQRRFLMNEWQRLTGRASAFPTLDAERLAQRYLETPDPPPPAGVLCPAGPEGLWQWRPEPGNLVALYRVETIHAAFAQAGGEALRQGDARIELVPPHEPDTDSLASLSAGEVLPGWRIIARLEPDRGVEAASSRRAGAYVLVAAAVNASLVVGALLIGGWMRRKARRARLENDLAATVSHELKTPLAAMRVLVDTLIEAPSLEEGRVRDYLRLLERENARLSRLIDNVLIVSRLESRSPTPALEEIPAGEIARRVEAAVRQSFAGHAPPVRMDTAPRLPRVRANPDALVAALLNLADNARKFSPADRPVTIRTTTDGGQVRFAVQDHGVGIARPHLKRVFGKYYQVDQRPDRNGGGCGLGLHIVRRIVDAHHGRVQVQSVVGEGSTFTVVLPALGDAPVPPDPDLPPS